MIRATTVSRRGKRAWRAFALLLALAATSTIAAACSLPLGGAATARGDRPEGHLLIVGGGRQPRDLVARFVELAGGPGSARIAVVPLASGNPEESGRAKVEELSDHGADAFVVIPDREGAQSDSLIRTLAAVTGIWFTGGDQARVTAVLAGTPMRDAIRERHLAGAVVGGTSAGAAIMSDSMLTGNQVLEGEDTVGYYGDEFRRISRAAIEVVPGLGFLPGAIVDQHFIERERHNRLLSVVLERPTMIGVGIAESTAIQVNPDGGWDVVGAGSVIVYDARNAVITPVGEKLGGAGLRMHVLPAGSHFDPASGRARLPAH